MEGEEDYVRGRLVEFEPVPITNLYASRIGAKLQDHIHQERWPGFSDIRGEVSEFRSSFCQTFHTMN